MMQHILMEHSNFKMVLSVLILVIQFELHLKEVLQEDKPGLINFQERWK
jgi:hypothetical protein